MKRHWYSRKPVIGVIVLLALALIFSFALSGLTASGQSPSPTPSPAAPPTPCPQTVSGKVSTIASDKSSFTVRTGFVKEVSVAVNQSTQYYAIDLSPEVSSALMEAAENMMAQGNLPIMGLSDMAGMQSSLGLLLKHIQAVTFDNLEVGDYVLADLEKQESAASMVLIIKAANIRFARGYISEISGSSFTIAPSPGPAPTGPASPAATGTSSPAGTPGHPVVNQAVLSWNEHTHFILKGLTSVQEGQYAVALFDDETLTAIVVKVRETPPQTVTPAGSPSPTPAGTTPPPASP